MSTNDLARAKRDWNVWVVYTEPDEQERARLIDEEDWYSWPASREANL